MNCLIWLLSVILMPLSAIDTLMQSQPDSALTLLLDEPTDDQQHGPLYLFSVAIPSGLSALIHNKTHGSIDHRNRWFEADASYKGSAYFDKYYGSGKEGYVAGSPDFFDRYSFAFEDHSPYKNPRTGRHIQNPHPISGKFHWTDIPITGISIEVLLFLLSL